MLCDHQVLDTCDLPVRGKVYVGAPGQGVVCYAAAERGSCIAVTATDKCSRRVVLTCKNACRIDVIDRLLV